MNLMLNNFKSEILDYFEDAIELAIEKLYDEIENYIFEVKNSNQSIINDDREIDLITKGNELLDKINNSFKKDNLPIIIDCDTFNSSNDYAKSFNNLLSNIDFTYFKELFYNHEKELLQYIAKDNDCIKVSENIINLETDTDDYLYIKFIEVKVE